MYTQTQIYTNLAQLPLLDAQRSQGITISHPIGDSHDRPNLKVSALALCEMLTHIPSTSTLTQQRLYDILTCPPPSHSPPDLLLHLATIIPQCNALAWQAHPYRVPGYTSTLCTPPMPHAPYQYQTPPPWYNSDCVTITGYAGTPPPTA